MNELLLGAILCAVPAFLVGQWVADLRRGMHDANHAMRRRSAHRKGWGR